jgi:hypothetical protein
MVKGANLQVEAREIGIEICDRIIECEQSKKNFKIGVQELELYRKLNIALPRSCFDARHQRRLEKRNPRELRTTACSSCSGNVITAYPEDTCVQVVCDNCYRDI